MISPGWAAAFASPPAAMALAMVAAGAAGAAGGENPAPPKTVQLKRDTSLLERKTVNNKLHTFSSFQKPLEGSSSHQEQASSKEKAAANNALLVSCRVRHGYGRKIEESG